MLSPVPMISLHGAQNGQETHETSPMILSLPTRTEPRPTSLLYDVRSQPTGKAEEDGCLFN